MGDPPPSSSRRRPAQRRGVAPPNAAPSRAAPSDLPEGHLALVIEDAIAEIDVASANGSARGSDPDLRQALLYGWATGAITARELALRATTDLGLRYLLRNKSLKFAEIRDFRESHEASLQRLYAEVFTLLTLAGAERLGRIRLPDASDRDPAGTSERLSRELLSGAAAGDYRDDRELGETARGDELPKELGSHAGRQRAFRETRSKRRAKGPTRSTRAGGGAASAQLARDEDAAARPIAAGSHRRVTHRGRARADAIRAVTTLAIVLTGLVFVRWLSAVAAPGIETRPSGGAVASLASTPIPRALAEPTLTNNRPDLDLGLARDEAMQFAEQALESNDLRTARDFYFLALQAVPDDPDASDRLREVEVALGIGDRRRDWDSALLDLGELRALAPSSSAVLQAYVTALVGAGRGALGEGDRERAVELCTEAARWFPTREDARTCLLVAGAGPTATETPPSPTATATPQPSATPTIVPGPATQIDITRPGTPVLPPPSDQPPTATDALRINLSASCQPGGAGPEGSPSIRVGGTVSGGAGAVASYQLAATAVAPSGASMELVNVTYLTPIFQVQQQVPEAGTYVVTVSAEKDGFAGAEVSTRVTC